MGVLTDILKEVPLSAVLKEKITAIEAENGALKTEVAILKDDLREAQAENKRLKDEIERLTHKDDLDETATKALTYLVQHESNFPMDSDLASALRTDTTRARYYAAQLEERGYITVKDHAGIMQRYTLTQKGRRYAIDNGLI
jgi:predicted transcriptional regulator